MASTEVTVGQYARFAGETGSLVICRGGVNLAAQDKEAMRATKRFGWQANNRCNASGFRLARSR
jgi:hypothetical protein